MSVRYAKIVLPLVAVMSVSMFAAPVQASSKNVLKYGAIGLGAVALYGIGQQAARTQPYYTTQYPQNNPNYAYQQQYYQQPQQQYYQQPQQQQYYYQQQQYPQYQQQQPQYQKQSQQKYYYQAPPQSY